MADTARNLPAVSRLPVTAIGILVGLTIASAAWFRLAGVEIREPDAPVTAERALRFSDMADGSVAVTDERTGRRIHAIEGDAGFARGVLRSLARERRRSGLGEHTAPLLLRGHADGRLTLSDPATGQRIDLASFGPTNAAVFAHLLAVHGDTP